MASQFQRNQVDAEEVIEQLGRIPKPEEMYEEVMVAVHPGFCLTNEKYSSAKNLRKEDYFSHTLEIHKDLEEAAQEGKPVDVVYRKGEGDEAVDYLRTHAEKVDNFIQSSHGSGFIASNQGKQSLAETINKVEKRRKNRSLRRDKRPLLYTV